MASEIDAPHPYDVPLPRFLVCINPNDGPQSRIGGYVAYVKGQRASEACPKRLVKTIYASSKPELNKRVRHFLGFHRHPVAKK